MDIVGKDKRREMMSRVRSHDTLPERIVRSLTWSMGFRYRLHVPSLPGKPDLVFRSLKKVIFVHGCFWHQHPGCPSAKRPSTNVVFWDKKLESNIGRDSKNYRLLSEQGWSYLVIWECQTKNRLKLRGTIETFLKQKQVN